MSTSWVSRAEPWIVAATPPMRMYSTPWPLRASRRPRNSAMFASLLARLFTSSSQFLGEAVELQELLHALAGREFQVLADQRPVDVLLVGLDHGIGLERGVTGHRGKQCNRGLLPRPAGLSRRRPWRDASSRTCARAAP